MGLVLVSSVYGQGLELPTPDNNRVEAILQQEAVTIDDLEVENPGLLSSNPFYFIKNLRRSTQRILVFNPIKRVEVEMDILNEKAAELKRLQEISPDNLEAALNIYQENIDRLKLFVKSLKGADKKEAFERLVVKLFDRAIKHIKLLDELKSGGDLRFKGKLNTAQSGLSEAVADVILIVDEPDSIRASFSGAIDVQRESFFKELRIAEIADHFEEKLPVDSPSRQMLVRLREDFILKSGVKIEAENVQALLPTVLGRLPGDAWRRIKILDEAREYLASADLRNAFGLVRQLILDLSERSRNISKPEAEQLIREVYLIKQFLEKKGGADKSYPFRAVLSRADFNLRQAEESLRGGQYAQSFGQASIAAAAVNNVLGQLIFFENGKILEAEILKVKARYDELVNNALKYELAPAAYLQLFNLFKQAEQALAKASDSAEVRAKLETAVLTLREGKILVWQAEQIMNSIVNEVQSKIKTEQASQSLLKKVLVR